MSLSFSSSRNQRLRSDPPRDERDEPPPDIPLEERKLPPDEKLDDERVELFMERLLKLERLVWRLLLLLRTEDDEPRR